MNPSLIEIFSTICFILAVLHTFSVKKFQHIAHTAPDGSIKENFFHLLGEIEVVFGFWAGLLLIGFMLIEDTHYAIEYMNSRNFTEPAFVFAIMTVAATKPVLRFANSLIFSASKLIPSKKKYNTLKYYFAALTIGPLLGSFITEPAAMTVIALLLKEKFYDKGISQKMMYTTLALLFVNISVGGTLTHFAAPPVLMVASKWNWGLGFMMTHFGYKTVIAVFTSTAASAFLFRKELFKINLDLSNTSNQSKAIPLWITMIHLVTLGLIVGTAHYMSVFMGIFLFFLGFATVSKEFQEPLKLREALLVGFFLGGLVILGGPQRWWLEPLLSHMDSASLFIGSAALTAITDNAALTYLGSLVPSLEDVSKFALVAGSVTGGGLTVIANAPNPVGYGTLNPSFGEEGISPIRLFVYALAPTLIAGLCLWFLPSL